MDVEIATERVLIFSDRVTDEVARATAWGRRVEAFGAMAKVAGFLARPKDEEFELVESQKRLTPFWRISSYAVSRYERTRDYPISLAPEVKRVMIDGQDRPVDAHRIVVTGHESCEEEMHRQVLVDAVTGAEDDKLALYLDFTAAEADAEHLAALAAEKVGVVAPEVKASGLVRDAVAKAIGKIEADKILEERVVLEAVDLYFRPVHGFRYRRAGKEATIEVDGLTGAVSTSNNGLGQHLGRLMEPKFLLDIGAEAANIFIPGATVAKLAIVKGIEMRDRHRLTKAK